MSCMSISDQRVCCVTQIVLLVIQYESCMPVTPTTTLVSRSKSMYASMPLILRGPERPERHERHERHERQGA